MANNYNTFIDRDTAYKTVIKPSLSKNSKELIYYIQKYIDANNSVLYANGTYALIWRYEGEPSEASILYKTTGYSKEEYEKMISDTKQIQAGWVHFKKPFWWAMLNCIKYYVDTKQRKELETLLIYLSCSMYATIHFKFYKGYPINPNIMEYTVNNLNNRYDLKKLGSLLKVLHKIAVGCHDKYASYFEDKNFCDRYIVEYMQNLFTRINNFVKEIKKQFQINKDNGKYLNYETDSSDPENYHEVDNQSYSIERLTNKCTNKIITSGINENIAESSAKLAGVSVKSIKEVVEYVINMHAEEIREFNLLFLQQYLIVDKHPIETMSSKNYIVYVNKIYTKSNTLDKGVIRLKELLDKWLKESCKKYIETKRVASKIAYRKAIYYFFTLAIRATMTNNY